MDIKTFESLCKAENKAWLSSLRIEPDCLTAVRFFFLKSNAEDYLHQTSIERAVLSPGEIITEAIKFLALNALIYM